MTKRETIMRAVFIGLVVVIITVFADEIGRAHV